MKPKLSDSRWSLQGKDEVVSTELSFRAKRGIYKITKSPTSNAGFSQQLHRIAPHPLGARNDLNTLVRGNLY